MNRAEWEARAQARRMGARSLEALVERRARDRRIARFADLFEMGRRPA